MTEPLTAIRNLSWRPSEGDDFLFDDADFELFSGERIALIGPSGSGKSTLLRCLVALEPRNSGTIEWRGRTVQPASIRDFRRHTLYLHQEPVDLASGSVADNLAFAREMGAAAGVHLTADQQRDLLAQFHLDSLEWNRDFETLSIGERQRIAMVRALTMQPHVLLLDEPTAALDTRNARRLEDVLVDYIDRRSHERALVWVSHDTAQAERVATRTVDINDL